ncbi:ribonuclease HII [Candidatus Parcubacteria bacterium]|nr:ribonuclease HII [Candidatus Parcubacteria bacterium]
MTKFVAGADEAGRGPLAGPVVCCIVVCKNSFLKKLRKMKIKDSKSLSPKKRKEIFEKIKNSKEIEWKISFVGEKTIDKINILKATFLGFKRCLKKLKTKPDLILIDGNQKIPNLKIEQRAIVDGDKLHPLISLASIIAKVKRDEFMEKIAKKYPKYKFEKHKGYPTKEHFKILKKIGPCKIHRKSFLANIYL